MCYAYGAIYNTAAVSAAYRAGEGERFADPADGATDESIAFDTHAKSSAPPAIMRASSTGDRKGLRRLVISVGITPCASHKTAAAASTSTCAYDEKTHGTSLARS